LRFDGGGGGGEVLIGSTYPEEKAGLYLDDELGWDGVNNSH